MSSFVIIGPNPALRENNISANTFWAPTDIIMTLAIKPPKLLNLPLYMDIERQMTARHVDAMITHMQYFLMASSSTMSSFVIISIPPGPLPVM